MATFALTADFALVTDRTKTAKAAEQELLGRALIDEVDRKASATPYDPAGASCVLAAAVADNAALALDAALLDAAAVTRVRSWAPGVALLSMLDVEFTTKIRATVLAPSVVGSWRRTSLGFASPGRRKTSTTRHTPVPTRVFTVVPATSGDPAL